MALGFSRGVARCNMPALLTVLLFVTSGCARTLSFECVDSKNGRPIAGVSSAIYECEYDLILGTKQELTSGSSTNLAGRTTMRKPDISYIIHFSTPGYFGSTVFPSSPETVRVTQISQLWTTDGLQNPRSRALIVRRNKNGVSIIPLEPAPSARPSEVKTSGFVISVVSDATGAPLPRVGVSDTTSPKGQVCAGKTPRILGATDNEGQIRIEPSRDFNHRLRFELDGFKPFEQTFVFAGRAIFPLMQCGVEPAQPIDTTVGIVVHLKNQKTAQP